MEKYYCNACIDLRPFVLLAIVLLAVVALT